jgi:hypothetical protein
MAPAPAAKLATIVRIVTLAEVGDIVDNSGRRRSVNKRLPRWQLELCGAEENSVRDGRHASRHPIGRLRGLLHIVADEPEFKPNLAFG